MDRVCTLLENVVPLTGFPTPEREFLYSVRRECLCLFVPGAPGVAFAGLRGVTPFLDQPACSTSLLCQWSTYTTGVKRVLPGVREWGGEQKGSSSLAAR
jgi:hypothetical protein